MQWVQYMQCVQYYQVWTALCSPILHCYSRFARFYPVLHCSAAPMKQYEAQTLKSSALSVLADLIADLTLQNFPFNVAKLSIHLHYISAWFLWILWGWFSLKQKEGRTGLDSAEVFYGIFMEYGTKRVQKIGCMERVKVGFSNCYLSFNRVFLFWLCVFICVIRAVVIIVKCFVYGKITPPIYRM